ncbi:uncharacterized protein LOC142792096 [Rhipicephalus microplus]|uniref:uncharacterized protein LOC142792096 n=1 Tax=Rhipicephalus microplus TaxID=6941 RepID=UPI003F6D6241
MSSTYFSCKGTIFRQNNETAMVASISVPMVNLTIEYIEEKALSCFSLRPKLFLRYMDDCFCVMKMSEGEKFSEHLNSVHPAVRFTTECESDHCLPFLEVQKARKRNGPEFSIHRKPAHTGRYLRFASSHSACHKDSVANMLLERAKNLCSNDTEQ